MKNWKTTLAGMLGAAGMAALGYLAKDAGVTGTAK